MRHANLSPYAVFGGNPIIHSDINGDDIINKVSDNLNKAKQKTQEAQTNYDKLVSTHVGSLTKKDVKNYDKQSGLSNAKKEPKRLARAI